ncbi:arginase family protein [Longimicrobium sp.]|uniref:arginase family protein n=1 Tax=Longimicrobium sp. TaxID=2029185 RepID=UPI002D09509F|nr:arginase family protein [Longimicrobium sp.]HSU15981.1 arginase family protein [Longimicrobium sp.]
MSIDLITVPYDSGHRGKRMGAGPLRFAEAGAAERLRAVAGSVRETAVGVEPELATEIATAFDLARATAFAVRTALGRGSLPLVLAGNCFSAVGTLAALPSAGTGVVWLDAHGDLNTPETTVSGMLDGMALATVLGRCWTGLARRIDGFAAMPEEHVLLAGARDLDEGEQRFLDHSRILALGPAAARDRDDAASQLDAFAARVQRIYLHVDLDVHAPEAGRANGFQPAAGLTADEVRRFIRDLAARVPIAAAAITAYDPAVDADGRMLDVGLELMELIAELAAPAEAGS